MTLRPDLNLIAQQIPHASRVLDLGCGDGSLLQHLINDHDCTGTGVEIDPEKVLAAIVSGVPVMELDVDADLSLFATGSYDTVVLSRTIQTLRLPDEVLTQMARIAGRCADAHALLSEPPTPAARLVRQARAAACSSSPLHFTQCWVMGSTFSRSNGMSQPQRAQTP